MKNFKKISGFLMKGLICMALVCPSLVSCVEKYDDTELRDKIDLIIEQIYDLEERLNGEIQTLKSLLSGKILITDVKRDVATGITEISLSNGSTLQLLPEKDLESYVTYITLSDGVDYWAYIDAEGNKNLFLDENGYPVPVIGDTPEVIVKDGDSYIVIGGMEYPLSGNSVFSDYELICDELTGEIYAVTFTFGEDMTFTVTVDGACGFWFVVPEGWSTAIINDYYVPNGYTERVQIDARGVVDYVLQIPDGWRVKEYADPFMGSRYFDITAPSKELVESGVAAGDGELKVVAVLEGGKATVAKLYLSTEPFREFSVSMGYASAIKYNGLQKFIYGVCKSADFDEETVFQTSEGLLDAFDYPSGYGVSNFDLVNESLSTIAGDDLEPGEKYIFWALPALYYQTAEDAGYRLEPGTFVTLEFAYSLVRFEVDDESFRDAQLSMELKGVDAYYTGLVNKEDFLLSDIAYCLNNPGYYTAKTEPMTYEGSVFKFAGVTGQSATEYVAWLAVAEEGRTYTEADIVVCEFSTLNLSPGSSVEISATSVTPADIEITAQIEAAGAETIYYAFLTKNTASKYADDAARATYLFQYGKSVKAASVEAKASYTLSKVTPETDYVLFAVATDSEGKYSNVIAQDCRTEAITYNDLTIAIDLVENDPGNVVLSISSEGAVGYLYWIGKTSDNTWKSNSYLGGNATTAQKYLYLNQDQNRITSVMANYPVVDGLIKMEDLSTKEEYVIVAMAKDAAGKFSKAVEYRFITRSIALGQVVMSTDPKWESARPTIEWIPESFHAASGQALDGSYSYKLSCNTEFTAYVVSGADGYFVTDGGSYMDMPVDDRIIALVEQADRVRDYEILYDEDLWEQEGYPAGHHLYHAPHGSPVFGYGVIFPGGSEATHHEQCSRPDKCEDYTGGQYGTRMLDVYYNTGEPITFRVPGAFTTDDIDKVFVALRDQDGNFYEPYYIDVPDEYFE